MVKAILYCFKCGKYICDDCLKNHDEIYQGKGHITIKQKIYHQYYCTKKGHEENILNRFCLKCNKYLCCDCNDCKKEHQNDDIYNFIDIENEIKEINNNVLKCEEIIEREERNFKNFIKLLENKINILTNLFNDYKSRNTNLISFYKILIDNYEQLKNIKNYNLRNNILMNNNFDLRNSTIYSDECLISNYNRMCEFYRNTNHIKAQEMVNYYITPKYCRSKIKKFFILNENVSFFSFERAKELCFVYKNINNENRITRMFYDNFINNIFPLKGNKYIYLDENNKLSIMKLTIEERLRSSDILSLQNIQFVILDIFNENCFFTISNFENSQFFILKYYMNDGNPTYNIFYQNSLENQDNMYLILKENKIINSNLFEYIAKIINNFSINIEEKNKLNLIFKIDYKNSINIQNLIDSNKQLLNYIDKINEDFYNKIKGKININENKYVINSNFIMKFLLKFNNENLTLNDINDIKDICNINKLCKEIIEKYIHYLIFNSKINNIYNYKNMFLLFMGEQYLFVAFSLKTKKFLGLESANLIKNDSGDFNNFEIIKIISNKIIINDKENKIIYIVENNNTYNFCLVKNNFNYYSSAQIDNKYLLFDNIKDNNLYLSLINLDDYSIENNYDYDFCQLLNFRINNNPPKIYLAENLSKFIYLYEDDNQIGIIDLTLNKYLEQNDNDKNNLKYQVNLKKDHDTEIIPKISRFSSFFSDEFEPAKILEDDGYFCTKTNKNEFITFKFDREYCFYKIYITFPDKYKKAKLKECKMSIYDIQGNFLKSYNFIILEKSKNITEVNINDKGAYLKFEFLKNYGDNYFCIKRIQFFADITHSLI